MAAPAQNDESKPAAEGSCKVGRAKFRSDCSTEGLIDHVCLSGYGAYVIYRNGRTDQWSMRHGTSGI